jgi:hypothetical protein
MRWFDFLAAFIFIGVTVLRRDRDVRKAVDG